MIVSFAYENLDAGWTLDEVSFDALNLLVGPSGAGKTRILEALRSIRKAALYDALALPSAKWTVTLQGVDEGQGPGSVSTTFRWCAETRVTYAERPPPGEVYDKSSRQDESSDARFVREIIERDEEVLVERQGRFKFRDDELPRLQEAESAIRLLASEPDVRPLHESIRLWRSLEDSWFRGSIDTVEGAEASRRRLAGRLELLQRDIRLPTYEKLYVLQEDHRELFDRIVADFVDVFPTVQELKVTTYDELEFQPNLGERFMVNYLAVGMREEGVAGWVPHPAFSSGMDKTLKLLIETTLAPKGAVLLIDELENSLGINCLPEVAGLMLKGLDRIQYIATSHHPRVINEIPYKRWKLVTRKGAVVKVLDAGSIPALETASSLEKFTQLINLREYEEGVA